MIKAFDKSRIEFVKREFFNDRIGALEKIGVAAVQIETADGGFLIETIEDKAFAAQSTMAGKLKKAQAENKSLKEQAKAAADELDGFRERIKKREHREEIHKRYEFMLLSAINQMAVMWGGLPREFIPLLKWQRYGDFAAARREYCELAGIPESSLLPEPDPDGE